MSEVSVETILGPGGALAAGLAGFEPRPGQLRMAEAVARAIEGPHHLVVEAGTGVGKSFAYLVPALLAAARQGRRIVVSTRTINLQEQLVRKDLPLLRLVLGSDFPFELLKGRSNYLSRRRLGAALAHGGARLTGLEAVDDLARLARWAETTRDGSRSDLPFRPSWEAWSAVESDPANCLGRACKTYRTCFYFQSVRRARQAHVVVVNHAMYLSDLALRRSGYQVLPDHDVAIFDEAHGLRKAATRHLGVRVVGASVSRLLLQLAAERGSRGLLITAGLHAQVESVRRTRLLADRFFSDVAALAAEKLPANGRVRQPLGLAESLSGALLGLGVGLAEAAESLPTQDLSMEVAAAAARCGETASHLRGWLEQSWDNCVYWVEVQPAGVEGRGPGVTLESAPLDVGPILRRELLDQVPTCIFTSATLATGSRERFDFFKSGLGLEGGAELVAESPFDYKRQVVLHLSRGLPDPSADPEGFEEAAIAALPVALAATRGHALVLFTSYRMLHRAARELAGWFEREGIALLVHGSDSSRSRLLDQFKADASSVLFGADSFWEGVDVPGPALSHLIVTRLPFRVPTDPIQEARKEKVESSGGRWFDEHSVPEAVLRLKQGFGRLIRSSTDSGRVTILDPRALTKPYGRRFLDALPACPRVVDDYGRVGKPGRGMP